jgi:hypothetical protein
MYQGSSYGTLTKITDHADDFITACDIAAESSCTVVIAT